MKSPSSRFKRLLTSTSLLSAITLASLPIHGEDMSIVSIDSKSSLRIRTAIDKTYFLEESSDLKNWNPVALYVIGDGTEKIVAITPSNEPRIFYRFTVSPTNISNPDDTDNDGIPNYYEMSIGLNPNWINSVTDLATVEIDSRISSSTALASLRIFNDYSTNGLSLIFQRNPACWINGIQNLSCISPWNNYGRSQRAGTLITPRHVIFCAHYDFFVPANYNIYFVTEDGVLLSRRILRTKRHPNYGIPYTHNNDIVVGVLDQDLPASVKCVKFLPDSWNQYLIPNVRTPSLRLNQHEEALVGDFYVGSISQENAYHLKPTEPKRLDFYLSLAAPTQTGLYGGDSGNGGFLVVNSQLILTNVWTYGGPGSGTSITNEKVFINTLIGELDAEVGMPTGYSIQEFDFSPYKRLVDIPPEYTPTGPLNPIVIDESDYPLLAE
jgi:hypothetical protein